MGFITRQCALSEDICPCTFFKLARSARPQARQISMRCVFLHKPTADSLNALFAKDDFANQNNISLRGHRRSSLYLAIRMANLIKTVKTITGLDKLQNFVNIIKFNGGVWMSTKKLFYHDDLKIGTLVGEDDFGNKYYENPYYFVPRNRWVEFNLERGLKYDASQIPPEWHRWMTHMTEYPPTIEKPVKYDWMLPHQENLTGTQHTYMPHSTVKPKIASWKPRQDLRQLEAGK